VTDTKKPSFGDRLRAAKKSGTQKAPVKLKVVAPHEARRSSEYWDFTRDGMTKSSLEVFLRCREQFRLQYVEGWMGKGCNMGFAFGNLLHWLIARFLDKKIKRIPVAEQCGLYHMQWSKEHPTASPRQKETMELAYTYMEALWPYYVSVYQDDQLKDWVKIEDNFQVPIKECGTIVRGIFDGVYRSNGGTTWIFETKGMSRIDEMDIENTLPFSLQNMLYVAAFWQESGVLPSGICYNVIRRPGQELKKGESFGDFRDRIQADVEKRPDWYFMRWEIEITKKQVETWYHQTLLPMLNDVSQWSRGGIHYLNPEALVTKYGRCDLFDVMVNDNYAFVERKNVSSRYER
jgi:hypothetical protein